jgi:Peptidase A4 family
MPQKTSSKYVDLLPTNLDGVRLFPPLPDGFDPLTATQESLIAHGIFLPRPDVKSEPGRLAKWYRIVGRMPRGTAAAKQLAEYSQRFEPQKGLTHYLRNPRRVTDAFYTSNNWNGLQATGNWNAASALITVPNFVVPFDYAPNNSTGGFDASMWVGLDGGITAQNTGSNDVLQTGISCHVDAATGAATYLAWFEWFVTDYSVPGQPDYVFQTNLPVPVNPGDQILLFVGYDGQGSGFFFFQNTSDPLTPWPTLSGTLAAPIGADANGSTVEWIVETPTFFVNGVESLGVLPLFGAAVFNDSAATTDASKPALWTSAGTLATSSTWTIASAGQTIFGDLYPYETATSASGYVVDVVYIPPILPFPI